MMIINCIFDDELFTPIASVKYVWLCMYVPMCVYILGVTATSSKLGNIKIVQLSD